MTTEHPKVPRQTPPKRYIKKLLKAKKPSNTNQSLTPVTIKQLTSAQQSHQDAPFQIDGKDIGQVPRKKINDIQVTIIGQIRNVNEAATNVSLLVDDGTGTIDVRIWLDANDEADYMNQKKSTWQ